MVLGLVLGPVMSFMLAPVSALLMVLSMLVVVP